MVNCKEIPERIKAKYNALPKLYRFLIFYGTTPIWVPPFVAFLLTMFVILGSFALVKDLYDNFDN